MPIYQRILNLDELFRQLPEEPIIINDLPDITEDNRELIKDLITTRYSSDVITLLPSCRCGATKGEFSKQDGIVCDVCGTRVTTSIEDEILPLIWVRKPDSVKAMINPIIWIMLRNRFKQSGFPIIKWIADKDFRLSSKQPPVIQTLIESGIQRGYNNFVTNFDNIISYLISLPEFRTKKNDTDYLDMVLKKYRYCVFSDYLPLPNKSLFIIDKTNVGVFVDENTPKAINSILMLMSIDKTFRDQSTTIKENRTIRAIDGLCDFYEDYFKSSLNPKKGQFKQHVYGTRTNFSFRAVVTSLTDLHRENEVHVPWGIGLTAFKLSLINKLLRLGMDANSSIGFIMGHINKYHPDLDKLLQELIAEAPNQRITIIAQRNPSQKRGSAQTLGITKFKTNPDDKTVGIPIEIVKAPNGDFDGDSYNFSIALDHKLGDLWFPLEPRFNVYELDIPDKISGNPAIPKPCIANMSEFLMS